MIVVQIKRVSSHMFYHFKRQILLLCFRPYYTDASEPLQLYSGIRDRLTDLPAVIERKNRRPHWSLHELGDENFCRKPLFTRDTRKTTDTGVCLLYVYDIGTVILLVFFFDDIILYRP